MYSKGFFGDDVFSKKNFEAARISSYDKTGGNADAWFVNPKETKVLAEIEGPGIISHIWFTIYSKDKHYLRKNILQIYWDDEPTPSVECPIGDFFGLGHSTSYTYESAAFSTSCNREDGVGDGVAMNCWLPMPFAKKARIEFKNEQEEPVESLYFYIDYQKHQSLPENAYYFHASWRRENPCSGWSGIGSFWGSASWAERMATPQGKNLTGEDNYLVLKAKGEGHFIGVNFSIDHQSKGWWGEGDDMFFIDRDENFAWPPDLHGTGSEDYLCHAWGMQKVSHMYSGQPYCEKKEGNENHVDGKVCVYRLHLKDPIPFKKDILFSIEHGSANNRSDDYASTAYWYQKEPHEKFEPMLPVELRLPNR